MKNIYTYIFLSFVSYSFSNTYLDSLKKNIDNYEDNRIKSTVLHLDYLPLFKSSFLINNYFPNQFDDIGVYGLKINGSCNVPVFQIIPEKIYFDINQKGTFSQLSYKHKKSEELYNAKLALKTDLSDKLKFLGLFESKSFIERINQNHLLSILKKTDSQKFQVSYMYHIDDAVIEYLKSNIIYDETSDYFNESNRNYFNRYNESFHLGINYEYDSNKYYFKQHSSFQVSNTSNSYDLKKENRYIDWHESILKYAFNNNYSIYLEHNYKSINRENIIDSTTVVDKYNLNNNIGVLIQYKNKYLFDFSINDLNIDSKTKISPDLTFEYRLNRFNMNLSNKNFINSLIHNDNIYFTFLNKKSIQFNVNTYIYNQTVEYGNIELDFNNNMPIYFNDFNKNYLKYNFLNIQGKLTFEWISLKYNYKFYDSPILFYDTYYSYEVLVSPRGKGQRYRPYGKIFGDYININQPFKIDITKTDLFVYDQNNYLINKKRGVGSVNLELGLIFNSFKISYILVNPNEKTMNEKTHYSDYMIPIEGEFSYIDIIWMFND